MARLWAILATLLALCACGRVGFDADGENPPESGPVSTTLLTAGGPIQGHSVIFHDPDGTIVGVGQTNADGTANLDVPVGGMVTVVRPENIYTGGIANQLFTIVGVEADDALTLGSSHDPWEEAGSLSVALDSPMAGATYYEVYGGCTGDGTDDPAAEIELWFSRACLRDAGEVDLIAIAWDPDWNFLGYSSLKGAPLGQAAAVTMPPWETELNKIYIDALNPPPSGFAVETKLALLSGGVPFYGPSYGDYFSGETSMRMWFEFPQGFADGLAYLLCLYHDESGDFTESTYLSYLFRSQSGVASATTHDLGSELLPAIPEAGIRTDTPSRPEVYFTDQGDLSVADGSAVVLSWQDQSGTPYEWWFLLPPGQGELQIPELPDFLDNFRPSTASVFAPPRVVAIDADFISGYDELRNGYGFEFFFETFDYLDSNYSIPRGQDWTIRASSGPGGFHGDL